MLAARVAQGADAVALGFDVELGVGALLEGDGDALEALARLRADLAIVGEDVEDVVGLGV